MKNYIFFIGGSGARVCRAFLHSCAAGIMPKEEVTLLLLDADAENSAGKECLRLYETYEKLYGLLHGAGTAAAGDVPAFQCGVRMPKKKVISPVHDVSYLGQVAENDNVRTRALEWFYTREEREQDLKKGFYARPNIGCVFFQDIQDKDFQNCVEEIGNRLSQGEEVRVILVGSVFGGTGASGLPSLMKIIGEQRPQNGAGRLHSCGVLIAPYFRIKPPQERTDDIRIQGDSFYSNTRAALRYYQFYKEFEATYLVGQKSLDLVNPEYADGGEKQANKPHIIEAYAAMAIKDFLTGNRDAGIRGCLTGHEDLGWPTFDRDFYRLADMLRVQAVLNGEICPYIQERETRTLSIWQGGYQWYRVYCTRSADQENLAEVNKYSQSYLDWMYNMQCEYDSSGELCWDRDVRLCGPGIVHYRGEPEAKNRWKRFNDLVDSASHIEYVLDKAVLILSCLGVVPAAAASLGCAGLLIRLFQMMGEKKKTTD